MTSQTKRKIISLFTAGMVLLSFLGSQAAYAVADRQLASNPGTTGLVSWWSLNETNGTRSDCYGSNHLEDINSVGSSAGKQGNAASFVDTYSEHLSINDTASLSMGDMDFTIGGWVFLNGVTGLRTIETGNWDENNPEEWWYRNDTFFQPDHSKTWSATDWFYIYAFFYGHHLEISVDSDQEPDLEPNLDPGDFILLDLRDNDDINGAPDGKPDHARVVVGHGDISQNEEDYITLRKGALGICETIINPVPTPPDTQILLINQHCVDRKHVAWDYNVDPETRKFYIHITD